MKVTINLASEPFRRDRPLIAGSIAVGVLLLGALFMFIYLAASERIRAGEARGSIAKLERQIQGMSREQARLESVLRQPQNAEVLERSVFLNSLLLRKGISWTKIFEDLEKVTPHDVRLITVRPQLNASNELLLDMVVGSQATEPVNTFIMHLESSPVFGITTVHNSQPPSQTEPLFRYRISVNYAQTL